MTIRKILQEPDPILRQISKPVETVGREEQQLMDDMLETMYNAPGIGLAAIQIGVPKNIIVMDISREKENKNPMYFVNPIIKNKSEEISRYEEGCLSLKNVFVEVDRPSTCEVEYLDYNGEKKNLKCNGLLATCIQHEYEHLLGVLMVDHLSKLKKTMIIKKLSKQKLKAERIVI
jgi:peptide deformylase|tara:strand:+ start:1007 stop:1531 length:525 start_codon:yes stop_codon:yes gene_type:complete